MAWKGKQILHCVTQGNINKSVLILCGLLALPLQANAAEWELVWSDEFSKDGPPDSEKWVYDTGFIANEELQYYTTRQRNVRVRNGALIIEAHKEHIENAAFDPSEKKRYQKMWPNAGYTSGRIKTKDKAEWQYGRFEARIKLAGGRGTWPAFWMLGHDIGEKSWPLVGEIDIMEFVGFDPNTIHANIHTQDYNHVINTNKGSSIDIENPSEQYHIYAVEWDKNSMDFFVDEKKYFTFERGEGGESVWPFDKEYFLLLNLAIGGGWGGKEGVDDSIFPTRMTVDYVRVYKEK